MSSEKQLNIFFGHHKCATTWVRHLVERLCMVRGDKWAVFDNEEQFGGNLGTRVQEGRLDFVAYTNANQRHIKGLKAFRGFHLVRDPRDILVSAYFSHRNSHPTDGWNALIEHREQLQQLSLEDGLLAEMTFSESVFDDIFSWDYGQGNVLELRFEDLVANPYQTMLDAFLHLEMISLEPVTAIEYFVLGMNRATGFLEGRAKGRMSALGHLEKVPVDVLLGTIYENRFERLSGGRKRGAEKRDSHYRKGEPGDWKNHFTAKVNGAFYERYGKGMETIAYVE